MDKELALGTFAYLIGHYKTHEETIINGQEIEAINYILDENERLEQQCRKQKEVINKAIEYIKKHKRNLIHEITHEEYEMLDDENILELLSILGSDK